MFNRSPYNTLTLNRKRNKDLYFVVAPSPAYEFNANLGLEMPFNLTAESSTEVTAGMIKGARDIFQSFNLSPLNAQSLNKLFVRLESESGIDLQAALGLVMPYKFDVSTGTETKASMIKGARLNRKVFNKTMLNNMSDTSDYLRAEFELASQTDGTLNFIMPFGFINDVATNFDANMIKGAKLAHYRFNHTKLNGQSDLADYFTVSFELANQVDGTLNFEMPYVFRIESGTENKATMIKGARLDPKKFNLARFNGMSDLANYFRSAFDVAIEANATLNLTMAHQAHIEIKPSMTGRLSTGGNVNVRFNRSPFNRRLAPVTHNFVAHFNTAIGFDAETGSRIALQVAFDAAVDMQAKLMSGRKRITPFNRSPFNRELTNVKYFNVDFATGLQLETSMNLNMLLSAAIEIASELQTALIREMPFTADYETGTSLDAEMIRVRTFDAHINTATAFKALSKLYHVDWIEFTGGFKPGDRIIIDSGKYKITRNGENVSHLYGGDFFNLNLGTNNLTWTDSTDDRSILFRITHRDRFLY